MATTLSNLPEVLVDEILSRVPITSLGSFRSSCKTWEALSEKHLLGTAVAEPTAMKQLLGFILVDYTICSLKLDLHGIISNDGDDSVRTSVNRVSQFDKIKIAQVLHCDGLLLCVRRDNLNDSRLIVCNLYLGETRLIKPRSFLDRFDISGVYAFGYDEDRNTKRNHKILRSKSAGGFGYEIYDFRADRWRVLKGTPDGYTQLGQNRSLSLKGNAYFFATEEYSETLDVGEDIEPMDSIESRDFLLCFDFKAEKFGEPLHLPFNSEGDGEDNVALSCVRDEQLAVLYQSYKTINIWISTEINPTAVSWSEFLEVDLITLDGFPDGFRAGSFFIDEEKQVAVLFDRKTKHAKAYIIGKDGNYKSVNVGDAPPKYFTSYVPSLVPLKINKPSKRKERDD